MTSLGMNLKETSLLKAERTVTLQEKGRINPRDQIKGKRVFYLTKIKNTGNIKCW